jgi:hypothetical protein
MGSDRRAFLQFAGLAPAAAAGLAGLGGTAHAAVMPATLTRSAFLPCIGDAFAFEGGAFELRTARLARVETLQQGAMRDDPENAFSLRFELEGVTPMAQDTYRVSHPRLGRFVLFVSPRDAEGKVLEAVFNRL